MDNSQTIVNLTKIKNVLFPKHFKQKSDFFSVIFPDNFSHIVSSCKQYEEFKKGFDSLTTEPEDSTAFKVFMAGNQNYKNYSKYGVAKLTHHLRDAIISNQPIVYDDPLFIPLTPRESMFRNIYTHVSSMDPQIDPNSNAVFHTSVEKISPDLDRKIKALASQNTPEHISYAIFLLVIVAIFHGRGVDSTLGEFSVLWEDKTIMETIYKVTQSKSRDLVSPTLPSSTYTPFYDEQYRFSYNLYMYVPSHRELYHEGTIEFDADTPTSLKATLTLATKSNAPADQGQITKCSYTGTPWVTKHGVVHINFILEDDTQFLMCFKHKTGLTKQMYYQTALVISCLPGSVFPKVQKAVITYKKLDKEDMPYVKGVLALDQENIFISKQQLKTFETLFSDAPWMSEFKEKVRSYIEQQCDTYYAVPTQGLLSLHMGCVDDFDQLRMMLALKSVSTTETASDCKDPENLHRIMR